MADTRRSLIAHVGGKPSTVQLALIERCVWLTLRCWIFDKKLGTTGAMSERDSREYLAYSNSLTRNLRALGLQRPDTGLPTLAEQRAVDHSPSATASPPHDRGLVLRRRRARAHAAYPAQSIRWRALYAKSRARIAALEPDAAERLHWRLKDEEYAAIDAHQVAERGASPRPSTPRCSVGGSIATQRAAPVTTKLDAATFISTGA